MEKIILFDLDGTLTMSGIGITKCVQYALEKMGHPEENLEKLEIFIGPPLKKQFMDYLKISEKEADKAVDFYRERYSTIGIYENELYPNVEKMLKLLKEHGYSLAVSSSKPEKFVNQILEYFKIQNYFDEVVGATMTEKRTDKSEVIEETMRRFKRLENRENIIMVGDKSYDIIGARKQHIPCIAVTYWYGTLEELKKANPYKMVDSVDELINIFIK